MKKLTITTLSFVALNFAASSCANKKPKTAKVNPQAERLFTQMDANKDGKLSKDEVKGPLLNDFMRIDMDSDGFLSKEEVAEAAPRNGNGQGRPQGGQGRPPNRQ
jgi:hypothetical protein